MFKDLIPAVPMGTKNMSPQGTKLLELLSLWGHLTGHTHTSSTRAKKNNLKYSTTHVLLKKHFHPLLNLSVGPSLFQCLHTIAHISLISIPIACANRSVYHSCLFKTSPSSFTFVLITALASFP